MRRETSSSKWIRKKELFDAVERVRSSFLCERLWDWGMVEAITDEVFIFIDVSVIGRYFVKCSAAHNLLNHCT